MKHTGKRVISAVLAVALSSSMLVGSVSAGDTLPYLDHSARGKNQPYGHGYRAEDFLDWSPETDPWSDMMRARIPLQDRNEAVKETQANPNLSSETSWFNLSGDYGIAFFDSYPYTNQFSQTLFNFWQYTDYYGSWHGLPTEEVPESMYDSEGERNGTSDWTQRKFEFGLVNMPNSGYTNAAHKNGVLSIGCIFLPRTGLKHTVFLTQDENGNFPYAEKLIEMCEYYGFDGWFINQEESIPASDVPLYKAFLKQMHDAGLYIQWYDSVTSPDGSVAYQNEFNSRNSSFVVEDGIQNSDSIFLNYWWGKEEMQSSAEHAKSLGVNPLDVVFTGVEAGKDRWNQPYDLRDNLGDDGQPLNSIASLGADFFHEGLDEDLGLSSNAAMLREKDEFQWMTFERERRWWSGPFKDPSLASNTVDPSTYADEPEIGVEDQNFDGVAAYIAERSVINGDTFYTNFNTGHGLEYRKNGVLSNDQEWSNIIIQDILPTWQWWVETEGTRLNVDFDYGTQYKKYYENGSSDIYGKPGSFDFDLIGAYNGGSSLVVYGNVDAENFIHLYKTDLKVNEQSKMDITFNKSTADNAKMSLGVIYEGEYDKVYQYEIADSDKQSDGWVTSTVSFADAAGKEIAAFGLVVEGEAADYQINIGQMKYTSGEAQKPAAPEGFTIDKAYDTGEMVVSWDLASYDDVKQYNLYAVKDGKEIYLGGTYDEVFYIKNVNEAIAEATRANVDGVSVVPGETSASKGSSIDFDAVVSGTQEEPGQVTLVLKAVSEDGTESDGVVAAHDYADGVSNIEVTAEDGKLNVTWEGGKADVVVRKEYSTDDRSWTASGENGCTVTVPTGAEADFARYTMQITTEAGVVTTYDGRMDDSYCKPYTGKVAEDGMMEVPLAKDWYTMTYVKITDGVESEEMTVTRYGSSMPEIDGMVDELRVKLGDYRGNESEWVTVKNRIAVTVSAPSEGAQVDTTLQFNAVVKNYTTTDEVVWSVEEATSSGTTIDENGLLTVAEDEAAEHAITVVASSKENPKARGEFTVEIYPAYVLEAETYEVYPGDTVQCVVKYKGTPVDTSLYTWSIDSQKSDKTSIDQNGLLTVGLDESTYRINVMAANAEDETFTLTLTVSDLYSLEPRNASVSAGESQQFYVVNNKTQEKQPASNYTWSIEGLYGAQITSADTKIDENGLFTKGADETCSYMSIIATDKQSGEKYMVTMFDWGRSASMTADAAVQSVKTANTNTSAPETNTLPKADRQAASGVVSQEVTWTVEGATSKATTVNEDGTLNIAADETAKQLVVRATSAADPSKSGTATVNVTEAETFFVEVITEGNGSVTPGSGYYQKGEIVTFTVSPDKGYAVDRVTVDGQAVELKDGAFTLTVSNTHQVVVTFKEGTNAPDTDDSMPIALPLALAGVALAAGATVLTRKKLMK